MFLKVFLLSLNLILAAPAFAARKSSCERSLIRSFQGLTEAALQRNVVSSQHLTEAADSERPVNPLSRDRVESPVHQQFFEAFQTVLKNADPLWPQMRAWLANKSKSVQIEQNRDNRNAELTKNIFRPRLIASIPVDSIKELRWREHNTRAVLELVGSVDSPAQLKLGSRIPFRAVEVPEPVSAEDLHAEHLITQWERFNNIKEPEHVWDLQFFRQSGPASGSTVVILRRSVDQRSRSKIEIFGVKDEVARREGEFLGESAQILVRRDGLLAIAVGTENGILYLERDPSGAYTSRHLNTPADGGFAPGLSLHETANEEILLAAARSARVYVFKPLQSTEPFRSYTAEKAAVTWVERDKGHSALLVLPEKTNAFAAEPAVSERIEPFGERISGEDPGRAQTIVLKNGQAYMAYSVFTHEQPLAIKILVYELYRPAD